MTFAGSCDPGWAEDMCPRSRQGLPCHCQMIPDIKNDGGDPCSLLDQALTAPPSPQTVAGSLGRSGSQVTTPSGSWQDIEQHIRVRPVSHGAWEWSQIGWDRCQGSRQLEEMMGCGVESSDWPLA